MKTQSLYRSLTALTRKVITRAATELVSDDPRVRPAAFGVLTAWLRVATSVRPEQASHRGIVLTPCEQIALSALLDAIETGRVGVVSATTPSLSGAPQNVL